MRIGFTLPAQFYILAILNHHGPLSPVAIRSVSQELKLPLKVGSIHVTCYKLVHWGLLHSELVGPGLGQEFKVYTITDKGKAQLNAVKKQFETIRKIL